LKNAEQRKTAAAQDTANNRADKYEGELAISAVIQAVCAGLLVLFTGLLACYGYRGWQAATTAAEAAKKSADVAEQTLTLTNRPWLDVSDWELPILEIDSPPYVKFKIYNFGKSPAWITRLNVKFTTIDAGITFPEVPDYTNWANLLFRDVVSRIIQPEGSIREGCPFALQEFPESTYRRIRKALTYLWVFGLIKYEDFLGEPHETAFSAQYVQIADTDKGVWIADTGPATYHYHDRKRGQKNTGLSEPE